VAESLKGARPESAPATILRLTAARWIFVLCATLALAIPILTTNDFFITVLTEALIFGIWAMSLDLLVGYTGLVSFGHAAGFGLGAYAAGLFAQNISAEFILTLLAAQIIVILVAFATGFVVTRLSGIAFAILTLCICQVLFQIAVVWRSVTGGLDGLIGAPLPEIFGRALEPGREFYLLTVSTLIIVYLGLRRFVDSPFGRTLQAIRSNEDRASAIGINVRLHKWVVFIISWMVAGIAGTLFVFLKAGANPMSLYWLESGNVLAMTILGGMGTLYGPIIGAIVFVFLRDEMTTLFRAWQFTFGLVFVLVILLLPSGLAGIVSRIRSQFWTSRY